MTFDVTVGTPFGREVLHPAETKAEAEEYIEKHQPYQRLRMFIVEPAPVDEA